MDTEQITILARDKKQMEVKTKMKKTYIGIMAVAILGLLLLSGCQQPSTQRCPECQTCPECPKVSCDNTQLTNEINTLRNQLNQKTNELNSQSNCVSSNINVIRNNCLEAQMKELVKYCRDNTPENCRYTVMNSAMTGIGCLENWLGYLEDC